MEISLSKLDFDDHEQLQFMFDVRTSPEVSSNLFGDPPSNFEQHKKWIFSQRHKRDIFLINSQESPIGYCQVYNIRDEIIEVGWAFHSSFHRKGMGYDAVEALIKKCVEIYPGRCMELFVKNDNIPAMIIYIKAGFKPVKINNGVLYMIKSTEKIAE